MATKPKRKKVRWGKEWIDNRDWPGYNEELVARGRFLLDLDWVESWQEEVDRMNEGKRGAPYRFPESLIRLQAVWHQLLSYRSIEGITRRLVEMSNLPDWDDYTTACRRVNKVDTDLEFPQGSCGVVTDGSGMKMHQAGEYRRKKYGGKKRRWVEVVISADPEEGRLLDFEVRMDGEGDSEPDVALKHMKKLVEAGIDVKKFWGDGKYDARDLFNFHGKHGIESAVPPRDDASLKARGSIRRKHEVLNYQSKTWDEWAKDKDYGKRWPGSEGIFSAVKRIFGEHTRAKTPRTACLEVERRLWAYERMRRYGKEAAV